MHHPPRFRFLIRENTGSFETRYKNTQTLIKLVSFYSTVGFLHSQLKNFLDFQRLTNTDFAMFFEHTSLICWLNCDLSLIFKFITKGSFHSVFMAVQTVLVHLFLQSGEKTAETLPPLFSPLIYSLHIWFVSPLLLNPSYISVFYC